MDAQLQLHPPTTRKGDKAVIRLLITADDCGLSKGINEMTRIHHERQIMSTGSMMMTGNYVDHAFALFADCPHLELGVHLNLTDGKPLTTAARESDLVQADGTFQNQYALYFGLVLPDQKLRQIIQDELAAQIEAFVQRGRQPAHLTTHQHFHVMPAARRLVYELADDYGVQWVRNSDVRTSPLPYIPTLDWQTDDPLPHKFFVPNYVMSVNGWLISSPKQMVQQLLKLQGVVELVVHPSILEDDTFPPNTGYSPTDRHRESAWLTKFHEALRPHLGNEISLWNTLQDAATH